MPATMTSSVTTRTTCPYCGVGCGVLATRTGEGSIKVKGDTQHPANFGRLCSKGAALADTVGLEGRLLHPEIRGVRSSWEQALEEVALRFRETVEQSGPDSVAFYVSGQLLTEDYYVANKLMKGFIGSANIDTNSRLCMSSSVAGHKRAFGEDLVPGCYEDLELADLIVLVGSNTAWCHPVLYQRIVHAKKQRPALRIVNIDPRRTATSDLADLHLSLKPGTDVTLFNGLLDYLRRHDRLDLAFLDAQVEGFGEALAMARQSSPSLPAVAAACGLAEADLATFYRWFAETDKTVTAWSQGVNQSSSGTDKVNAIINVHLATGRIGKPGAGPLSLTGQPNAMGGREVGGLANQLAAHMDLEDPQHRQAVQAFWQAPAVAVRPGLKAVELFQAVAAGKIKALWIMATNPVVSLPDARAVRRALAACPFVVVSDCEDGTDLKPFAHVRLPALAWGEKDGTVTNSERRISRQRAFLPPPGEARADWWAMTEVARRMGFAEAFTYSHPGEIFAEHASLSGWRNGGTRLFDISGLASLDASRYDALAPVQWPVPAACSEGTSRLLASTPLPRGKARMLPLDPRPPANGIDDAYPLVLNSGRIRDQWHTMTRTARSPRLNQHISEPYVELHPEDAARHGLRSGMLVRLSSPWGEALARARISDDQRPGSVFMPMHWSEQFARQGLVNALVNPVTDPLSGEPESKHTPVRLAACELSWHAFLITRRPKVIPACDYCATVRGDGYWHYELAGQDVPANWQAWARALLDEPDGEWIDYMDRAAGRYRCALLRQGRLEACLFVSGSEELPPRDWLTGLLAESALSSASRMSLLSGRPATSGDDPGRTICACFGVGLNTLTRAIASQELRSLEQIGQALRAGTNCGSCVPELKRILADLAVPEVQA